MIQSILVVMAAFSASLAIADSSKDLLNAMTMNYDCYYGQNAETDLAWQSVIIKPGCATGNICLADVYCRKSKTSPLKGFALEIKTQIVCNTKDVLCPAKANDCLKDPEVSFAARSGSEGGTFKEEQKQGVK